MKITLVIPLYNEELILNDTVKTVREYMDTAFPDDHEIIFVDDGSTDSSKAILDEVCSGSVRYISYQPNRGKGYAVRQGMLEGKGDLIVFTDCDLAYGLEVVSEMVNLFDERPEFDAVVGSRVKHPEGYAGYNFPRKLVSKTYLSLLRLWGGLSLSDSQTGIKGFRHDAAKRIFPLCEVDRFAFDYEAIKIGQKCGYKFGELPVKIVNHRPSTIRFFRDTRRMLRDVGRAKKRIKKLKIDGE
jgi:Glycosyltransferases involved in cell wall biogenesis